jgi:hypothetical protein
MVTFAQRDADLRHHPVGRHQLQPDGDDNGERGGSAVLS